MYLTHGKGLLIYFIVEIICLKYHLNILLDSEHAIFDSSMNIKEDNILKLNKILTLPFYNELAENGKILANLKPKKGAINKFISKQKI
uniref:Uncharacterized protein n=1 Tax=Meloidogyne enterolobii TaxID=390850 RepID=A0A6V7Y199_MELEN|nr:unnamed protein product [Meloidogyne enterolobii]